MTKHRAHEKKKAEKEAKKPESKLEDTPNVESDEAVDVKMTEDDEAKAEESGSSSLKRKIDEVSKENGSIDASPSKRPRSTTPPPPPPPPMTPGDKEQKQSPADIKHEDESPDCKQVTDNKLADSKPILETSPPPAPPVSHSEDDTTPIKTEGTASVPKEE